MCQNTGHISNRLSTTFSNQHLPRNNVEKAPSPPAVVNFLQKLEAEMIGAAASFIECTVLLFSTFTALYSIVSPKVKGAAYYGLVLLPLSMLLPLAAATEKAEKMKVGGLASKE